MVVNDLRKIGGSAGNRGLGRKKGVPNKTTALLKDQILGALDKAGGVDYLAKQAKENPASFLGLVGKVLPLQLHGAGVEGEHLISIITRRVIDEAGND